MKEAVKKLDPRERLVLSVLKENKTFEEIESSTKLKEVEVMRALQFLENKKVLKINTELKEVASLDKNGLKYFNEGLPERRFLSALKDKALNIEEIKKQAKLDEDEFRVCVGILKGKAALDIIKDKEIKFKLNENGRKLLDKPTFEERLVHKLGHEIKELKLLDDIEKHALENLKKRKKILKVDVVKIRTIDLTNIGKELIKEKLDLNLIESLTPEIIRKDLWRGKEFREYDIKINVPKIYPGKRHFTEQAIQYIKKIWLEMGFTEMSGNLTQSAFWDLDSLFVPQDHPAREMQDTFYVKKGKDILKSKLPDIKNIVKSVHETGGNTGSKGWQYKWDEEKAKEILLRTHTTVLSALTLSKLKNYPAKFFVVGKVFRNETLSWKHLFEFYQVEGIVVDENANLRNLIGYLKEFFGKMGFEKVRIRPAHFPYTEMSCEIDVYHPVKKTWIELGGAGRIRPEVVKSLLGKEISVLAWGIGLERTIIDYYNLQDIRDIYSNDIKQLRESKMWMK